MMGKYSRFTICPCCHKGGVIDLDVLGMCLFCWMKKEMDWRKRPGARKRRGYSRNLVITACALSE